MAEMNSCARMRHCLQRLFLTDLRRQTGSQAVTTSGEPATSYRGIPFLRPLRLGEDLIFRDRVRSGYPCKLVLQDRAVTRGCGRMGLAGGQAQV